MKAIRLILPLCLAFAPLASAEEITLGIGPQTVQAEVASTPQQREHGLMRRDHLCTNCGMLFVFSRAGRHNFWMKNTPLPLSIAFIAADGGILNIEEMRPGTTDLHGPQGDALYALEMSAGWFARNGIGPAGKVRGLQRAPTGQ